jgi:raffinose/stachyose/melibiose transport system permease protein
LENYIQALTQDPLFLRSFAFTAVFSLVAVVAVNFVGFLLALLVTMNFKGKNILRGIFFMPNLIGGILLGFTWQFIFVQIFGALGRAFEIPWLIGWLSNMETGFIGLLIVIVWQLSGYMMLIYLAQLQNIPDSLIEAAKIDGATAWDRLVHITLPLAAPAFTIGLFLTLSNTFKLFDQNIALTNGGPANSTQMLALHIYNTAFIEGRFGLAQSKAVIFLILVAGVSLAQLRISKNKEVQL